MPPAIVAAVSKFGANAKEKLSNPGAKGNPEDQLRGPFEVLFTEIAEARGIPAASVALVGESSVSELKTRPDYAVTLDRLLVGFVELKAPGKGADPRRFKDPHDKDQWAKLHSLPNLIYSDGNEFSLWQEGELVGSVVRLEGDVESSGSKLAPPPVLGPLIERFLSWEPIPPKSAHDLANMSAWLCRLLRDEVNEQLGLGSAALTSLATDWRMLLFPEATDAAFADGYAQAVTFGLLMARAKDIHLAEGFEKVGQELAQTNSLIGTALRFLTDNVESQKTLKTSLWTLVRVLDNVEWGHLSKGKPEAWLYFYEDFLKVYDNDLRKKTGSYYTPPEVVQAMVRLVDDVLVSPRFNQARGIASPAVTIADPAMGTGTFILGVLRKIAETVKEDEGAGAVGPAIADAVARLIAFEIQLGPFAVAQLRIIAEIVTLTGEAPKKPPRMFVTNTLGDPNDTEGWIPGILAPIAKSRKDANKIKREEKITVVLGNPPYKEKAKGRGGWIEGQTQEEEKAAPLAAWNPPKEWHVGTHTKHLRNLYIYFWRWATWKVFDNHKDNTTGIVCFITVAGFLSGPGFQKMRDYLRRTCDDIWVIDCSPDGHQPEVSTRIFQGVQQPVCIVLASRSSRAKGDAPACVRFASLPEGDREDKFGALATLSLEKTEWRECPDDWRAPFLPASAGAWADFPGLDDFFVYNGSGVMPGRTWVIAPDADSLQRRWRHLVAAPQEMKEKLFHPHLRNGKPGDKHINRTVDKPLPGFPTTPKPVASEAGDCLDPVRYGFRTFDRQWIIPDSRLINQPNPELWDVRSDMQVYLTAFTQVSPKSGPALTITGLIPDLHHYKGSFGGRAYPLWQDKKASTSNVRPALLTLLSKLYGHEVTGEDVFAYIAALAAHPAYIKRFREDLSTPGLRIPLTADATLFREAAELGRTIVWLHTFGERMADPDKGRPAQPPRLPPEMRPRIPVEGAIPQTPEAMPDSIGYDSVKKRLLVGSGFIENVEPAVWAYEVSGKEVLKHWFSYRKAHRERPIIGDRRPPSPLGDIQPDHWLAEYTTELINVLNVLGLLVQQEEAQAEVLERVCSSELISVAELQQAGVLGGPVKTSKKYWRTDPGLLDAGESE
jgi:hypothetical protein